MVYNIAHRGARSLAPENTMAAFKRGHAENADLWETDVRPTVDGELVLFHDDDLKRTSDAEKKFPGRDLTSSSFTLEELRSLDAGSWFIEADPFGQIAAGALSEDELNSFRGEKIPTLAEGLIFTRDLNWPVNLELKALTDPMKDYPMVDRVFATIDKVGIDHSLIRISSFYHSWLEEISEKWPHIQIQAIIGKIGDTELDWGNLTFSTYNANHFLITEEKIREVTAKNKEVNLFTVNRPEDMKRFIDAGATGIFTDFPQVLDKYLKSK